MSNLDDTTRLSWYMAKLKAHDWSYEFSDDHTVWQKGFAEQKELLALQRTLDPDFRLWNEYAPTFFRRSSYE